MKKKKKIKKKKKKRDHRSGQSCDYVMKIEGSSDGEILCSSFDRMKSILEESL
jgi:hypothetical protein